MCNYSEAYLTELDYSSQLPAMRRVMICREHGQIYFVDRSDPMPQFCALARRDAELENLSVCMAELRLLIQDVKPYLELVQKLGNE